MRQTHCPKCGRVLEWYGTERNGYGEAVYDIADGKDIRVNGQGICGDCAGRPRTAGEALAHLNRERKLDMENSQE